MQMLADNEQQLGGGTHPDAVIRHTLQYVL
jgi:hypothetical protein